jgi:phosphatidylserine/phosphatidylglycerophosphate/cardiolipin synthase-like enzyme
MTCGSDNFNRRSWTHDSELTCAIVDPDGHLLRGLRTALWSEHLGLPAEDPRLADIGDAGELWRARGKSTSSRARPHRPAPVSRTSRVWATPMYRLAYDPDGRPMTQRHRDTF